MNKIYKRSFLQAPALIALIIAFCICTGCIGAEENTPAGNVSDFKNRDVLYQVSSIDLLLAGGYDGFASVAELKKHGDTGLGTVDMLNGELIVAGGNFYTVSSDEKITLLSDTDKIPFAAVTFFDEDYSFEMSAIENISSFEERISEILPAKTQFYALKIEGDFNYLKTRSVPKQEKPYIKLAEVVKNQSVFEYENISGTVIGLWSPSFAGGLNVPGLHIHFISDDKTRGGHILDLKFDNQTVILDETGGYYVQLPKSTLGGDAGDSLAEQKRSLELALVEK